ncbi:hypothetical protein [Streptosporangium sp. V21-05]|uniref:hypothetical protein n=1 Tax=Streptosporangium sp. V21-05 TaxID=3446115 RepID=UPI003F5310FB
MQDQFVQSLGDPPTAYAGVAVREGVSVVPCPIGQRQEEREDATGREAETAVAENHVAELSEVTDLRCTVNTHLELDLPVLA